MENKKLGKNKPRHNPDKPQNKMGRHCSYYEGFNGQYWCERGWDVSKCKGNPHNCTKVKYKYWQVEVINRRMMVLVSQVNIIKLYM